jgi:hypothetical protein
MRTDMQEFLRHWERETDGTLRPPASSTDGSVRFPSRPGWRSIGELAWHLADRTGRTQVRHKQPATHRTRPKTIEARAPAFRVVHDEAVARGLGYRLTTGRTKSDMLTANSGALAICSGVSC